MKSIFLKLVIITEFCLAFAGKVFGQEMSAVPTYSEMFTGEISDPSTLILNHIFNYIEGTVGTLVMVIAALSALICGGLAWIKRSRRLWIAFWMYMIVALLVFGARAFISTFFNIDTPFEYSAPN